MSLPIHDGGGEDGADPVGLDARGVSHEPENELWRGPVVSRFKNEKYRGNGQHNPMCC